MTRAPGISRHYVLAAGGTGGHLTPAFALAHELDRRGHHVCPAHIPPEISTLCLEYALKAHNLLGCRGTSRSDFRWDDERGEAGLFLLEINTQPGMTPLSLVPEQAKQLGIDYPELVEIIIEDALRHFGKLGEG